MVAHGASDARLAAMTASGLLGRPLRCRRRATALASCIAAQMKTAYAFDGHDLPSLQQRQRLGDRVRA